MSVYGWWWREDPPEAPEACDWCDGVGAEDVLDEAGEPFALTSCERCGGTGRADAYEDEAVAW